MSLIRPIAPKRFDIVTDLDYVPKPNTICYLYKPSGKYTEEEEVTHKENIRIYINNVFNKSIANRVSVAGELTHFTNDVIDIGYLNQEQRDQLATKQINVLRQGYDRTGVMLWGHYTVTEDDVHIPLAMLMFGVMEFLAGVVKDYDFLYPYERDSLKRAIEDSLTRVEYLGIEVSLHGYPAINGNETRITLMFMRGALAKYMSFKTVVTDYKVSPYVTRKQVSVQIDDPDLAQLYANCFHTDLG